MANYYKTAFMPFFEKWKAKKRRGDKDNSLEALLVDFARIEFPGLIKMLGEKARFQFIELLKLLVLSHRLNKNDDFMRDPLIDFAIVRDPMYKYSAQAKDRFFSVTPYAFIFAHFASQEKSLRFAHEKFAENSDDRHPERMNAEVTSLGAEAIANLQEHASKFER